MPSRALLNLPPVTGPVIKGMTQMTDDSVFCGYQDKNLFQVFPSGIAVGTGNTNQHYQHIFPRHSVKGLLPSPRTLLYNPKTITENHKIKTQSCGAPFQTTHRQHNSCTYGSGNISEERVGKIAKAKQEVCCETVSSILMKSHQYGYQNKT